MRPRLSRAGALALGAVLLAGCSQSMRVGMRTLAQTWQPPAQADLSRVELNPQLHYLRVQIDTDRGPQVGLMVEGDQEANPDGSITSVWYGADGTVLRLRDGRLAGFADARQSWRVVDESGMTGTGAGTYTQVIDMQPGYRLGWRRQRELIPADAAPGEHALQGATDGLRWLVDRPATDPADTARQGWYAVDERQQPARILYGQQCLENQVCLRWQHWPPLPNR